MHLGNVYSALLSWLSARSQGGRWLLRIEDIDSGRSRPEYARQLMDDLEWLGLSWDGDVVWQSRRGDVYEHYYDELVSRGLTYPCYCTRADLLAAAAPHESDGRVVYPGTCRHAAARPGVAAATRLVVPDEEVTFTDGHYGPQTVNLARQVGDFVIRRKDGGWAYQLAVVIDDALMGVNEVVRGADLLLSTPQQLYLARVLGFATPCFVHLPLLCNSDGQRLSKRDHSMDLGELRRRYSADELIGRLAFLSGLTPTAAPVSAAALLPLFSWDKVPRASITVS
jgi:glutamyl-tRNA synthetase